MPGPRILIFSASIGQGHDGPAPQLATGIRALAPGAAVETIDFLGLVPAVGAIAFRGSSFHSRVGSRLFDLIFCGCRVVSYGWGHGHVRVNHRAYAHHGLAEVARVGVSA